MSLVQASFKLRVSGFTFLDEFLTRNLKQETRNLRGLSSRRSRHRVSMVRIHLFKRVPSCGERRPAVSNELHESCEIIDGEIELFETGCQPLTFVGGRALIRVRERFQYFCGPSAGAKSFENGCDLLAMFAGNGMVSKILHGAVCALREGGLELDDGLNDTIGFPGTFRRKDLCLFERRENSHGRSDIGRSAL